MGQPAVQPTILAVEDDAAIGQFLVELLSLYGYQIQVAISGAEALAQLAAAPVDMVLLDRRLPDMSGLDVCRQIRATIDAAVPIILLTADYSPDLQTAAGAAGVTEFLRKPFEPQRLLARIAARLES